MSSCVFCGGYSRGVEFDCCGTFVCDNCVEGDGFKKRGDGGIMFSSIAQVMCPSDGVWVDY